MKKVLIVTATIVAVAGTTLYAYKAYARYDGWGHGRHHSRMSADDMSAFADARIAALQAGLRLNEEQQKLWPPVETALKELAAKQIERREAFRSARAERRERAESGEPRGRGEWRAEREERRNPIERLRQSGTRFSEMGSDLTRLAEVSEPLYDSLDDAQKRRFDALAHAGMRNMGGMHRHREERGWRRHGEFDGSRDFHRGEREYRRHGEYRQHGEFRGRGERHGHEYRQRMEWTQPAPAGAERL